jgi:nucleoside 2-deoxyribosyltransferase
MKIYFAGSIRGGRNDKELYSQIIKHIQKYGEVLTEHIGNEFLSNSGESLPNTLIYKRDIDLIREADIFVAEVSTPSLGVGYEIGEAERQEKEMLCLYRISSKNKLSAMISGNNQLKIVSYETLEDAVGQIDSFFSFLETKF